MQYCPYCNMPMESGALVGDGRLFFLPENEKMPITRTDKDLEIHRAVIFNIRNIFHTRYPQAYLCRKCGVVIMKSHKNIKNKKEVY